MNLIGLLGLFYHSLYDVYQYGLRHDQTKVFIGPHEYKEAMELLDLNTVIAKGGEKVALILCTQNEILRTLTWNEVGSIKDKVRDFLFKQVKENNICIGLLMDKNVFIPSIILSLQELNHSFVFLTTQTLLKVARNLNIKWVVSYKNDASENNFISEDTLELSVEERLQLWRHTDYLEDGKHLNFNGVFCAVQTSGSTGENKIVRVPHSCIEKNVLSLNKHFALSNHDVIYWGTPLTFDPTLVELLLAISCHASLLIVTKLVSLNPQLLHDALFKIGMASFLQMVPSVFQRWNKQQVSFILQDSCLKTLAFGGEPFPQEILEYKRRNELKLFNLYGMTELSCWATISNVSEYTHDNQIPLGDALDETFIEIHNTNGEIISNGTGEIYIGSSSRHCHLSANDINLDSPFLVKTGDMGQIIGKNLFYKGRITRVIKRFGHKVNLHKIEEDILKETNLQSRLIYSTHYKKLLIFMLIEEYFNRNTKIRLLDKLRVKLLKIVPHEGFPDFIDIVPQWPLNEHGKISDKILENYYENSLSTLSMEKRNCKDIFIDILGRYLKTELGGNSILAMQFLSEFEESIGSDTPGELVTLLLNNSLQSCINYVETHRFLKRKFPDNAIYDTPKKNVPERNESHSVLWTYDLKACVDSSPLVFEKSDKTFIVSGSFAHMLAILTENGEEILKLNLPQEVEAKPCVSRYGNFLYIGCFNGSMYCIDLCLKMIKWEFHTLQKITSAACLCRGFQAVIVCSYDNFVYCLNAENGSLFWKTDLLGSIRADPIYYESLKTIYVGTTKGMCYALNEENGAVIWRYKADGPIFGSACIVNEYIIWPCVTGVLNCTLSTGAFKWTQKIKGNLFSSLTVNDCKIYFGCHDSTIYELIISEGKSKISRQFPLESETSSTPFVYKYGNKILIICVCNLGILYVIDANSGNRLFRYKLPAQSFSSPYVFKNRIYVGCRDNKLYCIDMERGLIK